MNCIHHISGRLRVRMPELKGHPARARRIESALRELRGIRLVQANTLTGSLLVHYNDRPSHRAALLERIVATGREHGLALPASLDVPRTAPAAAPSSRTLSPVAERAVQILIEKLVERSALALLGALF